ncbi:UNVERIFIED_ORG: hypothetical protein ABIC62_000174 [Burkholderia sp. 1595]|uniref:Uncharacterized protein n=1 Tax=Paraburkholderia terricola TaxID=169427 RepID=A0ABU1LJ84_9BURK|nr:hypothetical protein [Paraburkholderia terricola]MDR6479535.1 hypothetical protein [Paraburkholderia terricola]
MNSGSGCFRVLNILIILRVAPPGETLKEPGNACYAMSIRSHCDRIPALGKALIKL